MLVDTLIEKLVIEGELNSASRYYDEDEFESWENDFDLIRNEWLNWAGQSEIFLEERFLIVDDLIANELNYAHSVMVVQPVDVQNRTSGRAFSYGAIVSDKENPQQWLRHGSVHRYEHKADGTATLILQKVDTPGSGNFLRGWILPELNSLKCNGASYRAVFTDELDDENNQGQVSCDLVDFYTSRDRVGRFKASVRAFPDADCEEDKTQCGESSYYIYEDWLGPIGN